MTTQTRLGPAVTFSFCRMTYKCNEHQNRNAVKSWSGTISLWWKLQKNRQIEPLRAAAGQIPCGRDVELSSLRLGLGTGTALRSPHTLCVRGCSHLEHAALSKIKSDPMSWVLLFSGLLSLPVPTKHSAYHPAGSAAKQEWISRGGRVMECETPN